ncbi:MAG: cache domain-containing protein, partial [Pseudomonas sp.]|uniref:cache domain-containing protein n=1 Tax=Pseudomonas sp. TaxID=306 RepID=UPI003BB647DE
MLPSSFQARIASVLILLLLVVVGALYFAVQAATNVAVRSQAREQLDVGTRVFEQLLAVRGRQLHDAVQVLAADFAFKTAVASGDRATIRSALANHGTRINADAVMMLGLDGSLALSTDPLISGPTAARLSARVMAQQRAGRQILLLPIGDSIYLLVQATVSAPLPIARVMMGFRVDQAFARELRELTLLELTLVASQDDLPAIWISTLPASTQALLEDDMAAEAIVADEPMLIGAERYLAQRLVLASGDGFQV